MQVEFVSKEVAPEAIHVTARVTEDGVTKEILHSFSNLPVEYWPDVFANRFYEPKISVPVKEDLVEEEALEAPVETKAYTPDPARVARVAELAADYDKAVKVIEVDYPKAISLAAEAVEIKGEALK